MSSGFGTPARKKRNNKETPPRLRSGNTGTARHEARIQEGKKESSILSVLKKSPTLSNFNEQFEESEKRDLSDDDLGLISYDDDDNSTSFRSITDEKEKEEKERRKTLQEKHIKKEKTCTLEDCTITGGNKRRIRSKRKRSKRRKTNRKKTKKKRGKKAGGVSERPPPPPPSQELNNLQQIVRNFNDTIFNIGARIGRNETIHDDEFESIVNVGRGDLNNALLEMFPTEREGPRNRSIRFVNQLRDFVNLQMQPENEIQRLHHGQLVRALDNIIGFLSNRENRGREYVASRRRYD